MVNPFIEKARRIELEAMKLGETLRRGKRNFVSSEVSKLYEEAAQQYSKINDPNRVRANYKDAFKFAPEKEKKRIEGIIEGLEVKPGKNLFGNFRYTPGKSAWAILSILSLAIALVFISLNFTGYSVANNSSQNLTFAGVGFFIAGLVFTFFYFKNKK